MSSSDHISSLKSSILKLQANRQIVIDLCEAALLAMKNGNHYIEFGGALGPAEQTLTVDEALQILKGLRREFY